MVLTVFRLAALAASVLYHYEEQEVKATISCAVCETILAEISKPVITEQNVLNYQSMFMCDCGSTEVNVTVE